MELGRDDWIGLRVARYRDMAGMTQQELADHIGVSRPYISQIENGIKPVTTRALLIALAEGLHIATSDLTTAPASSRSALEQPLHAAVPNVRAAIDGALPLASDPSDGDLDAFMLARMACDYPSMGHLAAPVLARTAAAAEAGHAEAAREYAQAAFTASMALRPLGYVDLATRLAERSQWAAARSDNPVYVGAADFARAQCCLSSGVHGLRERSLTIAEKAADSIQGSPDEEGIAWYGLLHLQAGLAAGSLGRDAEAMEHIDEAAEAANHVIGNPWRMEFSPANVGVWRVAVAVEGADPGRAVEIARHVDPTALRTNHRRSHLLVHKGRALLAAGQSDAATSAFLEADNIASAEVRGRAAVREAVGSMLRAVRRNAGTPALRDLAVRVGVDPLATE